MPKVTIKAASGARLNVTLQELRTHERVIPGRPEVPEVRDAENNLVASAIPAVPDSKTTYEAFESVKIVGVASEAKEFEVGAGQRLVVTEKTD